MGWKQGKTRPVNSVLSGQGLKERIHTGPKVVGGPLASAIRNDQAGTGG